MLDNLNFDGSDFGYSTALAILIPFVVSAINQYNWPSKYKAACAVLICVFAALGQTFIAGKLDIAHLLVTFIYVVILSENIYSRFKTQFKALEAITTPNLAVDYNSGNGQTEPEALVTNPPATNPVPVQTVTEPVEAVDTTNENK